MTVISIDTTAFHLTLSVSLVAATGLQNLILWVATGVLVIASGLLVYSLLKIKKQPAPTADANQDVDKSSAWLDAVWTVIPIIILAILLLLTYQTLN
ncbi:MAG: hypothetical protein Kow0031_41590 [Anaerolineae bacterium]